MHSITPPAFKPAGLVYSVPRQSTLVFFFFCFPSSQVAHLVPACGLHKKRASLFFFCCCQLRHLSDTVKGVVFLNDITEAITESPGKVVFFFQGIVWRCSCSSTRLHSRSSSIGSLSSLQPNRRNIFCCCCFAFSFSLIPKKNAVKVKGNDVLLRV
jgi:hypothetical protein